MNRFACCLMFLLPCVMVSCTPDGTDSARARRGTACAELSSFQAPGLVIESVDELLSPEPETNPWTGQPMPAFAPHCKLDGILDGAIRFELRLPLPDAWNGRFAMGGGGGFVGSVQNELLMPEANTVPALAAGYATVGTDTGHQGSTIDASWALDNETAEMDFAERAVHVVAEVSKKLIEHHYGRDVDYSYFMGCSRGGGQGMIASQRYPEDFDGIVVGAPAYSWPSLAAGFLQNQRALYPDPASLDAPVVTAANRELLAETIRTRCDGLDGVEDGVLTDPRACDFDPATLPRCDLDPSAGCLTAPQLHAIQTIYRGPEVEGQSIFPGFPFGGENDRNGWDVWITGGEDYAMEGSPNLQFAFGTQIYKYLVFDAPTFDYSSYDFANWSRDVSAADALMSARDSDLSTFRDGGGKILFWHGWSDPALSALGTIEYYDALRADTENADDFSRLFMLPGVLHCGDGPGADRLDWLALVADWVENGNAPSRVVASHLAADSSVEFERALCAYPEVAEYDGVGDTKVASSYACVGP